MKELPENSGNIAKPDAVEGLSLSFCCLLGFVFSIIVNPARIFPALGALQLQDFLAIIALIGLIWKLFGSSTRLQFVSIEAWYLIFLLITGFGFVNLNEFGLISEGFVLFQVSLKTLTILILLGAYTTTPLMFRRGFFVFMLAVGSFELLGIKAVLFGGGMHAGRFDSWVGLISNSDAIAAFLMMVLPIQLELFLISGNALRKYGMMALCSINIILFVLTQTRSAFISFLVVFPLWLIRKGELVKRISIATIVVCMMVFAAVYMSFSTEYDGYFDRMKSIFTSEKYNDDANIQSRFMFWKQGLEIWQKFPVVGCGIGGMDPHETITYSEQGRNYTEGMSLTRYSLHQTFVQILAERGILGLVAYLAFILSLWRTVNFCLKSLRNRPEYQYHFAIAMGMRLGIVAFLINAMFMTITESWMIVIFGGYLAGLAKVCHRLKEQEEA